MDKGDLPEIITQFDGAVENPNSALYRHAIAHMLKQILPFDFSFDNPEHVEKYKQEFLSSLPIFISSNYEIAPATMSFYMLSKSRPGAFKFFLEMLSNWLIPGQSLNVAATFAVDFQIPVLANETLSLCEVMIHIDNQLDMNELLRNLPIIETELKFGMQSNHYARRVLAIRGLSTDAKTASIQEDIAYLISKKPHIFDYDLLTEMQHTLVMCRDEFKEKRECRHISRIICLHYVFRKELRDAIKSEPEKRHLKLKLFKLKKSVLGLVVAINFLQDKEVFEERHLMSAIHKYIPSASAVEGSFFSNKRGHENIGTLYLEIEKPNNELFTIEEIQLLKRELPVDLKDRIEHLLHPIFMPRNEEEIMRNILTLSAQIKYLHDLPQVIITFDQQTHSDLYFTVILVAPIKPGALSLQDKFKAANTNLEFTHDRTKTIGLLRKKYTKDASVFTIKISKYQFLRRDHSIDLSKARQTIIAELTRIIGDVRDFNGGMISKQHELLCALREALHDKKYDDLLLENFFYSLTPDVMRTVLSPQSLKSLFLLMQESIEDNFACGINYSCRFQKDSQYFFAMVKAGDRSVKEAVSRALTKFDTSPAAMASSFVLVYDIAYLGYLYLNHDPAQQDKFCNLLQDVLQGHSKAIE